MKAFQQNTLAELDVQGSTVLIIDDDPNNLAIMLDHLEAAGLKTIVAEDGESGLQRAEYARPDLIMLDVLMPGLDGFETCCKLKGRETTWDIPVIFMTALADMEHKVRGFEAGGVDYITKPFQREELLARVFTHLRIRELTSRLREANDTLEKRVEERTAELARVNEELRVEIDERLQAEEALANLNQRLEGLFEKRTEQLKCRNTELIASEKRYRSLVETMHEGILVVDREGRLTYVNRQMSNMLGMPVETLIGKECTLLIEEKQRQIIETKLKSADDQSALKFEINFTRSDGSIVSTLVTPTTLHDGEGCFHGYFAVVTDITHLKQLQTQLFHAQKLESIGQLASGIAHEINTPTQFVSSNVGFLADAFADIQKMVAALIKNNAEKALAGDALQQALETVDWLYLEEEIPRAIQQSQEGLSRVANLVRAMKEFSHPGNKEAELVDINHLIETTTIVARNEWKYGSDLQLNLAPDLPEILCLAGEMGQVFLNLLVNAAQAITEKLGRTSEGGKGLITIATEVDGPSVLIHITDTGCGIPAIATAKIFDPFFTTKAVGSGTGQGLAIAYDVVTHKHGGTLTFNTEVGEGTTFTIRLPIKRG